MSDKISSASIKSSSITDILEIGKDYFSNVEEVASYLGDGQKAYDSAEVLLLLIGLKGHYVQRSNLVDMLSMDIQKVKKSLTYLKNCGLITTAKKGLMWSGKTPSLPKTIPTDDMFKIYSFFYSIGDWYADLDSFWKVMTLIHTLQNWFGLGISDCAKRHFTICLCKGVVEGFTFEKTKQFKKALASLDMTELEQKYNADNFRELTEKKFEFETKRRRCLGNYQKAKLLLIRVDWWKKGIPHTIPKVSVEAFKKSAEYFPFNDNETIKETTLKRNTYIYEYLVRQQCTDDKDFSPMSPFYGHTLEERLEMLPKAIGHNSDIYNRGYLDQSQWSGIFNAEGTEFIKHKYVNRFKDPKYLEAISYTKWDRAERAKKYSNK